MNIARKSVATPSATSRSEVSNGTRLLQNVDGRSSSARRFRDLVRAFELEVGGVLTEADRGLIRQAASLQLKGEMLQAALVRGEDVDADQIIRIAGTSRRILGAISAKAAKRKPQGQDMLQAYLAEHYSAPDDVAEPEALEAP
jgi:hypothetical protein